MVEGNVIEHQAKANQLEVDAENQPSKLAQEFSTESQGNLSEQKPEEGPSGFPWGVVGGVAAIVAAATVTTLVYRRS